MSGATAERVTMLEQRVAQMQRKEKELEKELDQTRGHIRHFQRQLEAERAQLESQFAA